jgi:hypothetical protein
MARPAMLSSGPCRACTTPTTPHPGPCRPRVSPRCLCQPITARSSVSAAPIIQPSLRLAVLSPRWLADTTYHTCGLLQPEPAVPVGSRPRHASASPAPGVPSRPSPLAALGHAVPRPGCMIPCHDTWPPNGELRLTRYPPIAAQGMPTQPAMDAVRLLLSLGARRRAAEVCTRENSFSVRFSPLMHSPRGPVTCPGACRTIDVDDAGVCAGVSANQRP